MDMLPPLPFGVAIPMTEDFTTNADWRFELPRWNHDACIRCGACWLACPDGAVVDIGDGHYDADPRYCKGCGVCVRRCWTGCISMVATNERPPWMPKE
jgi:2-oxoacid:acceptor oxidoreductase delta subunit (pyruvate/2-ketoisovalerate family)